MSEEFNKHLEEKLTREIYLHSGIHSNSRVLQTGGGDGHLIGKLHDFNPCFCYALENDPSLIESARQNYPAVRFLEGTLEKIDFPDHFFHLIFSVNRLASLKKPKHYFNQAYDALQHKGICIQLADVDSLFASNKDLLLKQIESKEGFTMPVLDSLERSMRRAGFKHLHRQFLCIEFHQPQQERFIYYSLSGVKA
ncbi:MAG: class I SAM-dependent methyltransferase [Spirochaetales bacterium]|nr:class I SAM-dependent methyltransferase [Spirochaetales bacterium]